MSREKLHLQVNTRAGYTENKKPVRPLTYKVNQQRNKQGKGKLLLPAGMTLNKK